MNANLPELLWLLIEQGCDIHLADAAGVGDVELIRLLLRRGHVPNEKYNPVGGSYRVPLYEAAYRNHVEAARLLIEAGADIEMGNNSYTTPLITAAERGHSEMVRLLLQSGANAEWKNGLYRNASVRARRAGYEEIAELIENSDQKRG